MVVLSEKFKRFVAPGTQRAVAQLTEGDATCYPLYYFIPSITADGRYLIYHRAAQSEIQLYRLDLTTAESTRLTHAQAPATHWIPWCVDSGRGVLDHRSVLNVARGEVVYFDDQQARVVDVQTLDDRVLFTLPQDRIAIGQNCVTPDGRWFVYIHHDKAGFERVYPPEGRGQRYQSKGTALAAYNLDTGEHRPLVILNSPIHHVLPYDDNHVVFCHPTMENGMLLTDLQGGWYTHLRTQDEQGGCVCHYVATQRGIAYEVLGRADGVRSGLYDPLTHAHVEFPLPHYFGYTHTGRDPEGRLWFYENEDWLTRVHDMHVLLRHNPAGDDVWLRLIADWPTYGGGQKAHFHPQVVLDRQWLLFTGGDATTQTNHLFLLDIADLPDTQGITL